MSPVSITAPSITAPRKISFLFLYPGPLTKATQDLLQWLEDCGLKGHIGSHEIAGEKLEEEVLAAVANAFHALVLYGPNAAADDKALGELLRLADKRKDGFKVWPVLMDGAPLPETRRPGTKNFKARALSLRSNELSSTVPAFLRSLIPNWTRAHFLSYYWLIDEYLDAGRDQEALGIARDLFSRSVGASVEAYEEAPFDVPLSRVLLARSLHRTGEMDESLQLLHAAHRQILNVMERSPGEPAASHSGAFLELAESVMDMKMAREATKLYVDAVRAAEEEGALRHLAIAKGQLAQIRVAQGRPAEAVALCEDVAGIFRQLGDQPSLRRAWGQLGTIHRDSDNPDAAAHAFREAYNVEADAEICNTLAKLSAKQENYADAAKFALEAASLSAVEAEQNSARLDAVAFLAKAGDIEEARRLFSSIESGRSEQPWRVADARFKLESASGNAGVATEARQQAIALFAEHRRKGGDNPYPSGQVTNYIVFAVAGGSGEMAKQQIEKTLENPKTTERSKAYLTALIQVVEGARDPKLADHPDMTFDEAAEVLVLMDALT